MWTRSGVTNLLGGYHSRPEDAMLRLILIAKCRESNNALKSSNTPQTVGSISMRFSPLAPIRFYVFEWCPATRTGFFAEDFSNF